MEATPTTKRCSAPSAGRLRDPSGPAANGLVLSLLRQIEVVESASDAGVNLELVGAGA